MSTDISPQAKALIRHELDALKGGWIGLLILGIGLVVLGVLALSEAMVATLAAVITYGMLLIAAGVLHLVGAFWTRDWSGFFLAIGIGLLSLVVGIMTVRHPVAMSEVLTLLMATFFMVSGFFRIVVAAVVRPPQWGWAVVSGLINVLMGSIIYAQMPFSGFWVIGLFLGIELLFGGAWWIGLALALKRFRDRASAAVAAP
ncbi:MAG: DUF308 domain-containing protein [Isosphaeraceae bacterium]